MGEDNKNLGKLHIIDGATGKEIPCEPIQELIVDDLSTITDGVYIQGVAERFRQATTQLAVSVRKFSDLTTFFKRLFKDYPITKKRARKLLMAHGYDKNGANRHIECMKYRTLREVESRYLK